MLGFNLFWWEVMLFALVMDWGMIRLIRRLEPRKFRTKSTSTGMIGDLFLPFGIASSFTVAHFFAVPGAWYTSNIWYACVFIVTLSVVLYLNLHHIFIAKVTKRGRHYVLAPHELWHSSIFVVLFYMVGTSVVPFLLAPKSIGMILATSIGYGCWGITMLHDISNTSIKAARLLWSQRKLEHQSVFETGE